MAGEKTEKMGRPRGSKNKPKLKEDIPVGGDWLQRSLVKRDIKGLPELEPLKFVKGKIYNNDDLLECFREDGVAYTIEYLGSSQIQDENLAVKWQQVKNLINEIKFHVYGS